MKRYIFLLFILLAVAGCSDDEPLTPGSDGFTIQATIDGNIDLEWQAGDRIKVVCADELYTFTTDGEGPAAAFTDSGDQLSAAMVQGNPVSALANCATMYGAFRIQAEQTVNDGVNTARVPMFAYTMNSPHDNRLDMTFRPLASVLELTVQPYDMTVESMTITPAAGATVSGGAMAGGFTVDPAHSTVVIDNAVNSITLRFSGGLNLAAGGTFTIPIGWFAVEGGLEITFNSGSRSFSNVIWEDAGMVKTFDDGDGYKKAVLMRETYEFHDNSFARAWYVKADGSPSAKGTSWSAATTLASALAWAAEGSVIHVAAGTYYPENHLTGAPETDKYRSFELSRNVTLIGGYPADAAEGAAADPAAHPTVLDGRGASLHTVVVSAPAAAGEKVALSGITIRGGSSAAGDGGVLTLNDIALPDNYGAGLAAIGTVLELTECTVTGNSGNSAAGIYAAGSEITVNACTISNNTAAANGGGVWVTTGSRLTMSSTVIDGNAAAMAAGLYLYVPAGENLTADVSGTTVSNNTATGNTGGVYIRDESGNGLLRASFTDCTVHANSGAMGAAMQALNAAATFTECRFTDNVASGNGVIYVNTTGGADSDVTFDRCTFTGNSTTGSAVASALYVYNNGGRIDMRVIGSLFNDNATAGRGGALYARSNQAGGVWVTCVNSTFHGNISGSWGGAINLYGTAANTVHVDLISCTITGNANTNSATPGAVSLETAGTFLNTWNTIVSGNLTAGSAADVVLNNAAAQAAHLYTIVGDELYGPAGTARPTSPAFDAAEMLSPLTDNGGSTLTRKLIGTSATNPAIGGGMRATELRALTADGVPSSVLETDQTGTARGDTERKIGACVK